jgi:predicted phosphoribosyltransferase
MFENREDAARQLAQRLWRRKFHDPLILGIPRGGVVTAAVLARELDADLDIVLSRKLRAPNQPELAIGAVGEGGQVYLASHAHELVKQFPGYLAEERRRQMAEIDHRRRLFRAIRPRADVAGRTVIVTDDGIATGSTMIAALQSLRDRTPRELIVAVPVASSDRLAEVEWWCNEIVCLLTFDEVGAVGQFYRDFEQVDDDRVIELLRAFVVDRDRVCPV